MGRSLHDVDRPIRRRTAPSREQGLDGVYGGSPSGQATNDAQFKQRNQTRAAP